MTRQLNYDQPTIGRSVAFTLTNLFSFPILVGILGYCFYLLAGDSFGTAFVFILIGYPFLLMVWSIGVFLRIRDLNYPIIVKKLNLIILFLPYLLLIWILGVQLFRAFT